MIEYLKFFFSRYFPILEQEAAEAHASTKKMMVETVTTESVIRNVTSLGLDNDVQAENVQIIDQVSIPESTTVKIDRATHGHRWFKNDEGQVEHVRRRSTTSKPDIATSITSTTTIRRITTTTTETTTTSVQLVDNGSKYARFLLIKYFLIILIFPNQKMILLRCWVSNECVK